MGGAGGAPKFGRQSLRVFSGIRLDGPRCSEGTENNNHPQLKHPTINWPQGLDLHKSNCKTILTPSSPTAPWRPQTSLQGKETRPVNRAEWPPSTHEEGKVWNSKGSFHFMRLIRIPLPPPPLHLLSSHTQRRSLIHCCCWTTGERALRNKLDRVECVLFI